LAWLTDPQAPRLCLVTGSKRCGKSQLLAWLIGHGTRPGTTLERRVHSFVPLSGQTARTAAWAIAEHLSIAARTPGELIQTLAADPRRTVIVLPDFHAADGPDGLTELILALLELDHVRLIVETRSGHPQARTLATCSPAQMDLDEAQWTDSVRYAAWTAEHPDDIPDEHEAPRAHPNVDLNDPSAFCTADPWSVSALYEHSHDLHGGLRAAWLRAGQSLTREQDHADRALVLRAALGDDADPRHAQSLAELHAGSTWELAWTRVRGDIRPPWPGPARALAAGRGQRAGTILVADHMGTVRAVNEADAAALGRLPQAKAQPRAIASWPDGTVLVLDNHGHLHCHKATQPASTGLHALFDDQPTPLDHLVQAASDHLKDTPGTAMTATGQTIAVADASGAVHAFLPSAETPVPRTSRLHDGTVTALTAVELTDADGQPSSALLYSGGADGHVRAWRTDTAPLASPIISRPCAVTSLSAAHTPCGLVLAVSWADALVEHHAFDAGALRRFVPGLPVQAVTLTAAGHLVIGTDQALICLRPTSDKPQQLA
ncbi:hypothetical protein, partial [Streptomyces sp. NPDC000188]|uniref:hypothetical protein n=1 Tax=Streptomyces sp. NPDC000188 TaxID=3154245 RepID=UPI00331984E1